jgi:trehalose 6-phosphate phosphatase
VAPDYFFDKNPLYPGAGKAPIFLFLDFDGTLVPIQADPKACVLSPEIRDRLEILAGSGTCPIAVLSGRSLPDIKKRVAVKGVCYGGNHGLHISGPGLDFIHPASASAKNLIARVRRALEKELEPVEGIWIENKGFTFTLHYRQASREQGAFARKAFYHMIAGNPEKEQLAVIKGKKVVELVPNASWDKGKAALFILDSLAKEYLPVYVGDDLTDETAFRALSGKGITVRVGKSKMTAAGYYLNGQREMLRFLREVEKACGGTGGQTG